ncbi:hypothetical protein ACS0TY_000001 [Phlomoides rotata]
MSDTKSTSSQVDSFHSPLQFDSPLRSDDPCFLPKIDDFGNKNSKSLATVDNFYSPVPSPGKPNFTATSPAAGAKGWRPWPPSQKPASGKGDFPESAPGNSPVVLGLNRLVRDEPPAGVKKVGPVARALEEVYGGEREDEVGGERRSRAAVANILQKSERSAAARKVALVVRFSVMAADKTRGWSGDSYDRYTEYRYCLAVNIVGFVYSGFQAVDLAYNLGTEKHVISHHLRYHFDFSMDQILAYLLMSASSSVATKVTDWMMQQRVEYK